MKHLLTLYPAKVDALCTSIYDNRNDDPWGGNGYLSTILRAVKMQDATPRSSGQGEVTDLSPSLDYSTSAHRELVIKQQAAAVVRHVLV
jgi:hypothetical protein